MTGDELVVVAFGASKGVRTPFGRTAYDVRAAHRSGVEYEWVLIGPPLFDPVSWVGVDRGVTQASHLVAVPDCWNGSVWRRLAMGTRLRDRA